MRFSTGNFGIVVSVVSLATAFVLLFIDPHGPLQIGGPPDEPGPSIVDVARDAERLDTLVAAMEAAGIEDSFQERLNEPDFLLPGKIAFNEPDQIAFGDEVAIEFVLAPDPVTERLLEVMGSMLEGDIRTDDANYSGETAAKLEGVGFDVTPSGLQERTVIQSRPTKWTWIIKPTSYGPDKTLSVELFAVIGKDQAPLYLRTYEAKMNVDVSLFGRAQILAQKLSAFEAVATFLVAVVGGSWAVFLYRRKAAS